MKWETFFIGAVLGAIFMGLFIIYDMNHPTIKSAYYCAPDTTYEREKIILKCMDNPNNHPLQCEEISRKIYGVAGFQRGSRVFPCFKAETPEEKKACGGVE